MDPGLQLIGALFPNFAFVLILWASKVAVKHVLTQRLEGSYSGPQRSERPKEIIVRERKILAIRNTQIITHVMHHVDAT